MKDVRETLDRLTPEPALTPDWDAVLRVARPRRRSLMLQLAVATGVAALAALFVVAPWKGSERVGILDRALAAIGDGPVVHAVFRGDWGGTLVELETGDTKPLYGENEIWYDASQDLVHEVSHFGNAVQTEAVYKPEKANTGEWNRACGEQGLGCRRARLLGHDPPLDASGCLGQPRSRVRGRSRGFCRDVQTGGGSRLA